MTVAGIFYAWISPWFGDQPHKIFYVSSGLMLVGAAYFLWRLRGTGILIATRSSHNELGQGDAESA